MVVFPLPLSPTSAVMAGSFSSTEIEKSRSATVLRLNHPVPKILLVFLSYDFREDE